MKYLYRVIFTRGGVVLAEEGKEPGYLRMYINTMARKEGVTTRKIRNEYITYTIGSKNIYLSVYTEQEQREKVVESQQAMREQDEKGVLDIETALKSAENTPNTEDASVTASKEKANTEQTHKPEHISEDNKQVASEEDSDPEENIKTESWGEWIKKKSQQIKNRNEIKEEEIRTHLINRNVSVALSRKLAKKVVEIRDTFQESAQQDDKTKLALRKAIEETVPILAPNAILKEIDQHRKESKRPYIFCMVGVNGVGKSTTLSKLCLWILKHNYRICVAACDGFRSGAIEQLKKYVERFQNRGHAICLYEKGYGKDESGIASNAISHAIDNQYDVVLIDTCGRMPSNDNSMRSLSKLIRVNKPNKIFYVGEALVGNDAINQIETFNKYAQLACVDKSIDGIIVTKCDTVNEKVGTILTLSNTVNKPVVFIGTGQKNIDLLPFDINGLCDALSL
ncbi:signal recognition particle receptor subunit alpha [Nematocida sp. AWRm80]|nr:signal recognition particle receptor subunit alpha [Nematocida sp. AWRm80]